MHYGENMRDYICKVCGYVYKPEEGDPESGISPGISFAVLPDGWDCPQCGAGKSEFERYGAQQPGMVVPPTSE